jgi:hypothetical protein
LTLTTTLSVALITAIITRFISINPDMEETARTI